MPPKTFRKYLPRKRIFLDGHWFDSIAESQRYGTLKMLAGSSSRHEEPQERDIRKLMLKPRLPMWIKGKKLGSGTITLDFQYEEWRDASWHMIYEDSKSIDTDISKFRRQVCEAIHDIKIRVVQT